MRWRFAKDASSRVFYMDRGELWEEGPPTQIFGHPKRRETYDFIFRVRSWEWSIDELDYDFPALTASLETFCSRQFLGLRLTNNCLLALEELTEQFLIPIARRCGIDHPNATFLLSAVEGGKEARLEVDCRTFVDAGVD